MDAGERLKVGEGFMPRHLVVQFGKRFLLSPLQNRKGFDDRIPKRRWKIAHCCQNIVGELTMMRALFDDCEMIRPAHDFPHLGKLRREHSSKERTDADAGKIIAAPPDLTLARAIVTELRMIERLLHEPVEAHRPVAPDRVADKGDEFRIAGAHELLKS